RRDGKVREEVELIEKPVYDFQQYLQASETLLQHFKHVSINNAPSFDETVPQLVAHIEGITDSDYLTEKLLKRFQISPMAIPDTHLALLHTHSSKVEQTCFVVFDLATPVTALSMNHQEESISRILVMLTRLDECEEVRHLMTAISQSIIENHLYTDIYKTGNKDIIYQLLKQIFTEKIKKSED